jgi:hypothetical protein
MKTKIPSCPQCGSERSKIWYSPADNSLKLRVCDNCRFTTKTKNWNYFCLAVQAAEARHKWQLFEFGEVPERLIDWGDVIKDEAAFAAECNRRSKC